MATERRRPFLQYETNTEDAQQTSEGLSLFMKPKAQSTRKHRLDLKFLKRLAVVVVYSIFSKTPGASSAEKKAATKISSTTSPSSKAATIFLTILNCSWVLLLLGCCLGEIFVGNEVGKQNGAFSKTIVDAHNSKYSKESLNAFLNVLWVAGLWIAGITLLKTVRQFMEEALAVSWRTRLTENLQSSYLSKDLYYKMVVLDDRVDNPDQRLTTDIDQYSKLVGSLFTKIFSSPITVVYYTFTYTELGWQGPVACYVMFLLGFIINKILISPLVTLWFRQEHYEGDFRFSHVTVRTNAESIAFYRGEDRERQIHQGYLRSVIINKWRIIIRNIFLNFHMNFYGYLGAFLNFLIIGFAIWVTKSFVKDTDSAGTVVMKIQISAFQSIQLIYGFTQFIQLGSDFSELGGYVSRLGDMIEVMSDLKKKQTKKSTKLVHRHSPNSIKLDKVSVYTPYTASMRGKCLVKDLTLQIDSGSHTLIMGPSGAGKSSILRVLGDLWPSVTGSVAKPNKEAIWYIPQKAYTFVGSLRDQITYPESKNSEEEDAFENGCIVEALTSAKLEYLMNRVDSLDVSSNWSDLLSPGERQRLSFCRLFYHFAKQKGIAEAISIQSHNPIVIRDPTDSEADVSENKLLSASSYQAEEITASSTSVNATPSSAAVQFVILDESTSALDVDVEQFVYENLKKLGVTLISVGHRPTLKKYHDRLVKLDGKGGYTIEDLAAQQQ